MRWSPSTPSSPTAVRAPPWWRPEVETHLGDVRDPEVWARALPGVDAVCHQAARVGLGRRLLRHPRLRRRQRRRHRRGTVGAAPRRVRRTDRARLVDGGLRRRSLSLCASTGSGAATPRTRGRPRGWSVRAARAPPAPRRWPGRTTPEDAPARPAERLRRHEAPPGAPVPGVRDRARRAGHGAALPQRLRAPVPARHALRRRRLDLPIRGGSAARLPRSSRTAARPATSCTSATWPGPTSSPSPLDEPYDGPLNIASGTPRTVLDLADGRLRGDRRSSRRSSAAAGSATCATSWPARTVARSALGLRGPRAVRGALGRSAAGRGGAAR